MRSAFGVKSQVMHFVDFLMVNNFFNSTQQTVGAFALLTKVGLFPKTYPISEFTFNP